MNTQKITGEYRLSQWIDIIQKRQESGQTINDFCQATGINRNAYYYWLRKIRKETYSELSKPKTSSTDVVPNGWMQLTGAMAIPQQINSTLVIEISGCNITVNADTDPDLLKKVCLMLRSL